MRDETALEQVHAAVLGLFEGRVAVGVTDPREPQPRLMPSELPMVANAIPARQREFAGGRAAARAALAGLGITPTAIPASPDRAPIWPQGVVGSISHTRSVCVAVAGHVANLRSLGVDIEAATPLDDDMIPVICSDFEQTRIAGPDRDILAKLIFSAKEAAYKAQYPLTGMFFGFEHLDVTLDVPSGTFTATFLEPAGPFTVGDTLPGRFAQVADHLVTGVAIGQGMAELDTGKGT